MSARLTVNQHNNLQENNDRVLPEQPAVLKLPAKIISYLFHPVFILVYVIYFLAYVHPYLYAGFNERIKTTAVMAAAFIAFTFFPLVTVLLLKGTKFIDSIYLRTQKDRVIPFYSLYDMVFLDLVCVE